VRHLEARLRQSGQWTVSESLTRASLLQMLFTHFAAVDFEQAKNDAAPFLQDTRALDLWSAEFFYSVSQERLKTA
jgi:hypothetical protein